MAHTKEQLEEANKLLQTKVQTLTNKSNALMQLLNTNADYLKEVEKQILSLAASIGRALESHETLSAPIPPRNTHDGKL